MNNYQKTGVWLIGAYGDIATTLIVGNCALKGNLISNSGLVTELDPMKQLGLLSLDDLVIGGHDIVDNTVNMQAEIICDRSRTYSYKLLQRIAQELDVINENIVVFPELSWSVLQPAQDLPPLVELGEKLRTLIKRFMVINNLAHVVVVNIASAEEQNPVLDVHNEFSSFVNLLETDRKDLVPPSMLCAYVAFMEKCSYINFTPNIGASIGGLHQLAHEHQCSFYGNDGKTGETLVKTALAPMFAARNLRIMSWEGINLLGNGDGETLNKPENCKNKLQNKAAVLPQILGYPVHSGVGINYVPSLGDWKTAWDLIHFQGFLDVPMTMQFTWQGCDSILAAPLIIDMIRLAEFAHRNGEHGPMHHLASFFKNPIEVNEHAFYKQFEMLLNYTYKHLANFE